MEDKKIKRSEEIGRRDFLLRLGAGAAVTAAALAGCKPSRPTAGASAETEVPTGGMTYRTNPSTGDRVSILGYGCMRWPTLPDTDG